MKDKLQTGRKYLQTTYLEMDSYLEYIKNSQNSAVKKQTNHSIIKWTNVMKKHLLKKMDDDK